MRYSGWVIFGTLVFFLLGSLSPLFYVPASIFAWLVPALMWKTLGKNACKQALVLLCGGVVSILFAAFNGVFLGWEQIFAINLPLLAMFVAVAFLTLTNSGVEDPDLPKGNKSVVTTAIGTHLLGAVINLSVLFVFGERMQKDGRLSRAQLVILARSFCAAAWWSPFFIATGVAFTYAPGMLWSETLVPGGVMALIAMSYSIIEICFIRKDDFSGYPIKVESLTVPVFLAAVVISIHHFLPDIPILILICLTAPVGALVFMKGRPRLSTLHDFIDNKILSVKSQFSLFLAAGVFSTGIKSITLVYPELFNLQGATFSPMLFAVVLGVMIAIGVLGVHPVVSIAIVSPLLLPLNPDPSQLGFLFLSSWAVSTGSSPLSGVGLALTGRFLASPRMILQSNFHYAIAMWLIASILNVFFFVL